MFDLMFGVVSAVCLSSYTASRARYLPFDVCNGCAICHGELCTESKQLKRGILARFSFIPVWSQNGSQTASNQPLAMSSSRLINEDLVVFSCLLPESKWTILRVTVAPRQ
jgi:hypothetical protein